MSGRVGAWLGAPLMLLLGACASVGGPRTAAPRVEAPPPQTTQADAAAAALAEAPPDTPVESGPPEPPPPPPDVWQRLSRGFAFAACDDDDVMRWIRHYAADPISMQALLRRALPGLEFVLAQVERSGLPTEFALLPLVESEYRQARPHGTGVAGIWQLMPSTAREHGLRIDREYDGRLDLDAATGTALALLASLHDQFPQDWRLVDMAYNAGHYRVAMAMAARERRGLEVRADLLALPETSHAHVGRLEALACLVRDPGRYALRLPDADPGAGLVAVAAAPGLDLELASRLSGVDIGRLYELNPGYLKRRVPRSGTHVLVLPRPGSERLSQALAQIPASVQATFGYTRTPGATEWQALATRTRVPRELLAALNGATPDQRIPAGTRLYLPVPAGSDQTSR